MPSSGFGTRLIDLMVRALGGQISRTFDTKGFRCEVLVPVESLTSRRNNAAQIAPSVAAHKA